MPTKRKRNKKPNPEAKKRARARRRDRRKLKSKVNTGMALAGSRVRNQIHPKESDTSFLAYAIALPSEYPLVRLPTEDSPLTAVVTLKDQVTINTPVSSQANGLFPPGTLIVAYFGQISRTAMVFQDLITSQYSIAFDLATVGTGSVNYWNPNSAVTYGIGTYQINEFWPASLVLSVSATGTHGPVIPLGVGDDQAFVWMNVSDQLRVTGTWGTFTGSVTLTLMSYDGDNLVSEATQQIIVVTGGVVTLTNFTTSAGYYALRMDTLTISSGSATSNQGLNVSLYCNSTIGWRHYYCTDVMNNFNGDPIISAKSRVNAASCLLTNTSSEINKQGGVLAARLNASKPFFSVVPGDLESAYKYVGAAANGVYTFKEFTIESEHFTQQLSTYQGGTAPGIPIYDLGYSGYIHYMTLTNAAYATQSNSYTVTYTFTIEFQTDVQRFARAVSTHKFASLVEARKEINAVPQFFFENPNHLADVYGWIMRNARGAAKHVLQNKDAYMRLAEAIGALLLA